MLFSIFSLFTTLVRMKFTISISIPKKDKRNLQEQWKIMKSFFEF